MERNTEATSQESPARICGTSDASGAERLLGLERVSILQCQELAKDLGYDSTLFELHGPSGFKNCKWMDAYFGVFQIVGSNGFLMVSDFQFVPDVWCKNLKAGQGSGS